MTAHTPGPWRIAQNWTGKFAIVGPGNDGKSTASDRIANCPGGASHDPTIKARGLANANLIAAAPELLAALRYYEAPRWVIDACMRDSDKAASWQASFTKARAAIAKAEGRS